jgi:2-oxoacid:acceptor oxidoreductase gamma subunit (pyruvate/2-ketoisovalerate family)
VIEIRIHGRGGQGGVTLAKIIATARFLRGDSAQAFGLYAAERSGAPIQAFCRFDSQPITNRNLIYEPDHVVVLDPTLIGPTIVTGLKRGGWILVNTQLAPVELASRFAPFRVATVDATAIARANGLGTTTVPIVNTPLAGALARMLEIPLDEMLAALEHLGFVGANLEAASRAFAAVVLAAAPDDPQAELTPVPAAPTARGPSFLAGAGGALPALQTGQWATTRPQRQQLVPPCNHVCPAGNDVQGFLQALARGQADEALSILLETSPFPAVCGRVCPAPCMDTCNRIGLDGAVNVRQLERYAADHGVVELARPEPRSEWIGIVGSGPAGLTAAYHLARLGYRLTVYEAGPEIGGLLRTGIPRFRLPTEVLERELDRLRLFDIEWKIDHPIDRAVLFELAREHDALLVATGLQELGSLRLGTDEIEDLEQGIVFLDRVRAGTVRLDGERVLVIGGGNTAVDAARTALRLGAAAATILYRRTRAEMPAIREEIDEALEEGVEIEFLTQPVGLAEEATSGASRHRLTCRRMELGAPDNSGRRAPVEVLGSDFDLTAERVILALGQSADLTVFPEGTEVREGEALLGLLERPVFAIGDLATGDGTVAAAIGSGRRSALHIHETLTGELLGDRERHTEARRRVDVWSDEVVRGDAMRLHLFERQQLASGASLAPRARRSTFDEIHTGLADSGEARRCLSCGVCNECDRCVTYCPEGVLKRVGHEFVFDYSFCKGCSVCASECPRNVIFMSHL